MNNLIKKLEGFVPHPYFCPANKITFGYGHVILAGDVICGVPASEIFRYAQSIDFKQNRNIKNKKLAQKFDFDNILAQKEANRLLESDTGFARKAVKNLVKVIINENQKEALISLVFNIGSENFKKSTLLKKLNTGDYESAYEQFPVWNKITVEDKKVISKGLVNRRKKEMDLFNKV